MASSRPLFAASLLAFALALVAGCDDHADVEDLDASELAERFACDDLTLVAASKDGEHALMIGIDDGLVANTLASGQPTTITYELPDDRLTVRWVTGSNVYQGHCGRDSGEPWTLDARSDAVAGAMSVSLDPGPGPGLRLEAEVHDVWLADDDSDEELELYLDTASFAGIHVD